MPVTTAVSAAVTSSAAHMAISNARRCGPVVHVAEPAAIVVAVLGIAVALFMSFGLAFLIWDNDEAAGFCMKAMAVCLPLFILSLFVAPLF